MARPGRGLCIVTAGSARVGLDTGPGNWEPRCWVISAWLEKSRGSGVTALIVAWVLVVVLLEADRELEADTLDVSMGRDRGDLGGRASGDVVAGCDQSRTTTESSDACVGLREIRPSIPIGNMFIPLSPAASGPTRI